MQVADIIDQLRAEGRDDIDAGMVANIAVPEGSVPDDHPNYTTGRDPWSVAWDEAHSILNAR